MFFEGGGGVAFFVFTCYWLGWLWWCFGEGGLGWWGRVVVSGWGWGVDGYGDGDG